MSSYNAAAEPFMMPYTCESQYLFNNNIFLTNNNITHIKLTYKTENTTGTLWCHISIIGLVLLWKKCFASISAAFFWVIEKIWERRGNVYPPPSAARVKHSRLSITGHGAEGQRPLNWGPEHLNKNVLDSDIWSVIEKWFRDLSLEKKLSALMPGGILKMRMTLAESV